MFASKRTCAWAMVLAMLGTALPGRGAVIWSIAGGTVTFDKPSASDETNPAFWDKITDNVWITRGATKGLYNAKTETFFNDIVDPAVSPADTQWAFSSVGGNPTFAFGAGAAQHAGLTFNYWEDAAGGQGNLAQNIQQPAVVHLISEDIYLDIQFSSWQQHAGGGFTYTRTAGPAPAPEPATLGMAAVPAVLLLARRGRRGRA